MANISKGLGKGLGALMGDDMMALHEEKTSLMLPISQVESCRASCLTPMHWPTWPTPSGSTASSSR